MGKGCHGCRFFSAGYENLDDDSGLERVQIVELAQKIGCSAECTLENGCELYMMTELNEADPSGQFKKGVREEFLSFMLGE